MVESRPSRFDASREAYLTVYLQAVKHFYDLATQAYAVAPGELWTDLDYPKPPFDSEYCRLLAKIPTGYTALATSRRMSSHLIHILIDVILLNHAFERGNEQDTMHTAVMQALRNVYRVSRATKSTTERFLCRGLIAHCILLRWIRNPKLLTWVARMPMWLGDEPAAREIDVATAIWVGLNVALALYLDPLFLSRAIDAIASLLRLYPATRNWDCVEQNLRKFFHNETFLSGWKDLWAQAATRGRYCSFDPTNC